MPKAAHHDSLARLFELLKLLPSKAPGITAKEICDRLDTSGFSVSKRTIERDLVELSRLFGLECNDKGSPYGWHWMAGRGVDLPGLTMADALSLHIVEDLLRSLLPHAMIEPMEKRFAEARNKLEALSGCNPNARWAEKVCHVPPTLPLVPAKIAPGVLATIQDALLHDLQVDVVYKKLSAEEPVPMRLHPLGLVQRGPVTYLVARAFDYLDVWIYAVHRIKEATRTSEPVVPPEGFSLDGYVKEGRLQFGNGDTLRLEVLVSPEVAAYLAETPLAEDQRLTTRGERTKLTATVFDTWQLSWWILSHGPEIEVVKPVKLRNQIAASLREAALQYAD